jgi:hypothetical protein
MSYGSRGTYYADDIPPFKEVTFGPDTIGRASSVGTETFTEKQIAESIAAKNEERNKFRTAYIPNPRWTSDMVPEVEKGGKNKKSYKKRKTTKSKKNKRKTKRNRKK